MPNYYPLFIALLLSVSCAVLHHVQVGDVDDRARKKHFFDIKASEVGVNLREARDIARMVSRRREADGVFQIMGYFQMGPHTGNPVYDKKYPRTLLRTLYQECPSGRVTGVTSIRETAKYPVISGEIVRVTGWCME